MNEKTRRDASDSGRAWVSRRAVTAGAAWSVPAVVLAASAASAATTTVTFSNPQTTRLNKPGPGGRARALRQVTVTQAGSLPRGVNVVVSAPTSSGWDVASSPTTSTANSFNVNISYTSNSTPAPAPGSTFPVSVAVTPTSGSAGPWTYSGTIQY